MTQYNAEAIQEAIDQDPADGPSGVCETCGHAPILHRGGTGDSWTGWCEVNPTPWDSDDATKCPCTLYIEA